ncbi:MAG TPA: electron transfer flavoprotein subunit beta/FixA family protein [Anaerolineae bacterium]|nr:electron transfer flavoprotein subunit beta/FixA family protein [Anaerolineae bacterium]
MNIVVCLKQIPDLQQIRIKGRKPLLEGAPLIFGDMDKSALEEAVRIKERTEGTKVIALALGGAKLKDGIKEALAIGADEAVLLMDPLFDGSDTMGTARVLAKAIERIGEYDLILCGEGSTDNYSGQVGPRLAEILDLPQITYVRELEIEDGKIRAVRNMEESFEVVEADLPALVTVADEINQPRLASLRDILRAARKPVQEWTAADLGLSEDEVGAKGSAIEVVSNLAPEQERKQVVFEGDLDEVVEDLVNALTKEGVLGR